MERLMYFLIGCGPALVSIVASLIRMKFILVTDGDLDSIQLAQRNLEDNCRHLNNSKCQQLLWFQITSQEQIFITYRGNKDHIDEAIQSISQYTQSPNLISREGKPDFIFASDVRVVVVISIFNFFLF